MVAPNPRHFVQHGLEGVGVVDHQRQAEIAGDKGIGQSAKADSDQKKLGRGRRACHRHQNRIAALRPHHGQDGLQARDDKSKDQGEMAKLDNHGQSFWEAGLARP